MNAPLVERRGLAPRLEVQVRVVSGDHRVTKKPGARYFSLTERGLGELVAHAARLEAGASGKGATGIFTIRIKRRAHEPWNTRKAIGCFANWRIRQLAAIGETYQ